MKKNLLLILQLCLASSAIAQTNDKKASLIIRFDLDNAKQTLALLRKKQVSPEELKTWSELPGTKAAISKVRSSADTAISAIKKIIYQQPLTTQEKHFQFDQILKNINEQELFVNSLENKKDSITSALKKELEAYLPVGKSATITLYGLMGTYSAGFAFTRDPSAFYMGLHFYKSDIIGVSVSAKHELFHTIQSLGYNYSPVMEKLNQIDTAWEAPYYLIRHLYLEGSAEFMADGKNHIANSPFLKNEYEHNVVNTYRHDAVFYLLEHLLLDIYSKPHAMDFDQVYSILFDWNWNNPAYYAGREMITALVKEYGSTYINQSLGRDALFFVKDYINLVKSKKEARLYTFSAEFEKMVDDMLAKL